MFPVSLESITRSQLGRCLNYRFYYHFGCSKNLSNIQTMKASSHPDEGELTGESGISEAGESVSKNGVSEHIMPHILNLYGSRATPSDFEIYDPKASFEDPLVSAHGLKQIKSSFYSLSKAFRESKIEEYSVEEKEIAPGKHEILIDNKQKYIFLGKTINMISLIKLYVEDGKVVRHEDWWDKKPIINRETSSIQVVGRLKEIVRRGTMLATHAMMGFGKDPRM